MADDQQTAEPRSAVEAAASPAHGGGQAPDLSGFEATGQYVGEAMKDQTMPAGNSLADPMWCVPDFSRFVSQAQSAQMQASQQGLGQSMSGLAQQPAARTIGSGIARLRVLVQKAAPMLHEGAQFVAMLDGRGATAQSPGQGSANPETQRKTVPDSLHDVVSDVETLIAGFGQLLARAKAAHG